MNCLSTLCVKSRFGRRLKRLVGMRETGTKKKTKKSMYYVINLNYDIDFTMPNGLRVSGSSDGCDLAYGRFHSGKPGPSCAGEASHPHLRLPRSRTAGDHSSPHPAFELARAPPPPFMLPSRATVMRAVRGLPLCRMTGGSRIVKSSSLLSASLQKEHKSISQAILKKTRKYSLNFTNSGLQ